MPIYEFECSECQKVFETIVGSAAKVAEVTCKHCGSSNIKKTISAGSYRVGSGASSASASSGGGCPARGGFS